jgi:hypothetical protein
MKTAWIPYLVAGLIVLGAAAYLLAIGREPICTCGYVKLWHANPGDSETSQHISDWYTPSHIYHGIIFYGLLWLFARRLPIGWRFAIAVAVEAAWEVFENSAMIIERYRAVTISRDYYGDSVLNATADILAMAVGFWLARHLPVWASVAIIVVLETISMIVIRDGLALNILMLVWPLEAVLEWQSAG